MWGVIGQERAAAALERGLREGRIAHAYLFVGPERVGKATLALKLAQALNCEGAVGAGAPTYGGAVGAGAPTYGGAAGAGAPTHGGEEPSVSPCGECKPCRRIAAGLHADVQTVSPALATDEDGEDAAQKGIHVSQIREIERVTALKPFEGRSRVVIIDPADEMNTSAQNAFLKTLEEPPPQVVLVLITADEARLLETIRSRCRRLEFRLPPLAEIETALVERGVEAERARLLARLSRGRTGWALEYAADESLLEKRAEALEGARSLAAMSVAERMDLAERLAPEWRRRPETLLSELAAWRDWWRDVLLVQSGTEDGVANVDRLVNLREDAARSERRRVASFLGDLAEAGTQLRENGQPRLVLETLLLSAPAAGRQARR